MRVDNDGIGLHVEREGEGPPVVLLHGITYSTATYRWLVARLRDRCTTWSVDFRGHGHSDRAPGAYFLGDFVSDAIAVLGEIGEPAVLVGHSLGGSVAAVAGQRHPELVRGLFLEDPAMYVGPRHAPSRDMPLVGAFALLRAAVPQWQEQGATVEQLLGPISGAPASGGGTLGELLTDDGLESMVAALLELDASVLDPVLEGTNAEEYRTSEPIGVPTIIVAPDPDAPDGLMKPRHLDELRSLDPALRVEVLQGAGHLIHDARSHRAAYLEHLEAFLAELDVSEPT